MPIRAQRYAYPYKRGEKNENVQQPCTPAMLTKLLVFFFKEKCCLRNNLPTGERIVQFIIVLDKIFYIQKVKNDHLSLFEHTYLQRHYHSN